MDEFWDELFAFIVGGGLTGLIAATREYLKARSKRARLETRAGLMEILKEAHEIQVALEGAREILGAVRVLLLYAHNGGGAIKASTPIFSSVISEAVRPDCEPRMDKWHEQQLDGQYIELLRTLIESKATLIDVADMPPSKLRDVYETDNISFSLVKLVEADWEDHTAIWYISAVMDQEDPPTAIQRDAVRTLVAKMSRFIRGHDIYA